MDQNWHIGNFEVKKFIKLHDGQPWNPRSEQNRGSWVVVEDRGGAYVGWEVEDEEEREGEFEGIGANLQVDVGIDMRHDY